MTPTCGQESPAIEPTAESVDPVAAALVRWLEARRVAACQKLIERGRAPWRMGLVQLMVPMEQPGGYSMPREERRLSPFVGDSTSYYPRGVHTILERPLDAEAEGIASALAREVGDQARFYTNMGVGLAQGSMEHPDLIPLPEPWMRGQPMVSMGLDFPPIASILLVMRLCVIEYLALVPGLDRKDLPLASRLATETLQFLLGSTIDLVARVPVAGLAAEDGLEWDGLRLMEATQAELGQLFIRRERPLWADSTAGRRLPPAFVPLVGLLETTMIEVRRKFTKVSQPQMAAPVTAAILAIQLRGHKLAGVGLAAIVAEPTWLTWGVPGVRVPLPQLVHGANSPIDAQELEKISALAGRIESVLTEGPGTPAELALRRFGLGLSRDDDRDAVVDFSVALEAVLVPGRDRHNKHRRFVANGASYTLGAPAKQKAAGDDLDELYEARSMLVHGGSPEELQKTMSKLAGIAATARGLLQTALRKALDEGWPDEAKFRQLRQGVEDAGRP